MPRIKPVPARVEITLPRAGDREDPNLFVGVNGVSYLLPKGKRSSVPPEVAAELERAERARDRLELTRGALQKGAGA